MIMALSYSVLQTKYPQPVLYQNRPSSRRPIAIVFSVVSAPDNTVQSKLVSLINVAGF